MINLNHSAFVAFIMAFASIGCNRADSPSSASRIVIQIPNKSEFLKSSKFSAQTSALSVIDYNLLCFAVNISGPAIRSTSNACDVERGITTGSVAPGNELIVSDVPLGENYTFEIFGLLRNNTSEICPSVNLTTWNHPLVKIYLVGKTKGIKLEKQEEEVTITLTMPDSSAHIALQNSFPLSCTSAEVQASGSFLLAASILTSTSFKLKSRVSFKEESKELLGTTLKIKRWKTEY